MREHFVLREAFHGYPLIEVLIKARGYRLSMVYFALASVSVLYFLGWNIVRWVHRAYRASGFLFVCYEQKKIKTNKIGLHAELHFTYD